MPATYRPGGALPRGTVTVTSVTTRTVRAGIVNRAAVPLRRNAKASGARSPRRRGRRLGDEGKQIGWSYAEVRVLARALFATIVINPPQSSANAAQDTRIEWHFDVDPMAARCCDPAGVFIGGVTFISSSRTVSYARDHLARSAGSPARSSAEHTHETEGWRPRRQ